MSIEDILCKSSVKKRCIARIEDFANPLHLVYVNLRRVGVNKKIALKMSGYYEKTIYELYRRIMYGVDYNE